MLADISHSQSQSLMKQRNALLLSTLVLLVVTVWLTYAATSKDREVLLIPTISRPLAISSSSVTSEYLEMTTRDVATMALNRSPASLDYWMEQVLKVVHPTAYGRVKADLLKLVDEQRGSDVSQAFTISGMKIYPKSLTSDVSGTLTTFVGNQVVSSEPKTFRFIWSYSGLSLSLVRFGLIVPTGAE